MISKIEYYGAQMSVFLTDVSYASIVIATNSCWAVDRFTIHPAISGDHTCRAICSGLLIAYATEKVVKLMVDDTKCSGDRAAIQYMRVE